MSEDLCLKCREHQLELGRRTHLMGVLNLTPDSFSKDGIHNDPERAIAHAKEMVAEGADIIDVGGESSRPGSQPVSWEEELKRISPVVKVLTKELNVPISVDTYKEEVAEHVLDMGAHIINDITGLRNADGIAKLVAEHGAAVVVMHMQGSPKDMQLNPHYEALLPEITEFLAKSVERALQAGVKEESIVIDPGIGFGKRTEHNLEIMKSLGEFKTLGKPLLLGPSRKSVVGDVLGLPVEERLEGTIAAVVCGVLNGANIVRVHDVKKIARAVRMADAIKQGESWTKSVP